MKPVWKSVISLVFMIAAVITLNGCGGNIPNPVKDIPQHETGEPEDIITLYMGYNHMTRFCPYDYVLRDKGGEVLFSCFYYDDENEEVNIEDVPVDREYMDRAKEIVKKYGFVHMRYREPGIRDSMISDAPMYSLTMYWPEGKSLRLNYWPGGAEELEQIFEELREAQKYNYNEEEI